MFPQGKEQASQASLNVSSCLTSLAMLSYFCNPIFWNSIVKIDVISTVVEDKMFLIRFILMITTPAYLTNVEGFILRLISDEIVVSLF